MREVRRRELRSRSENSSLLSKGLPTLQLRYHTRDFLIIRIHSYCIQYLPLPMPPGYPSPCPFRTSGSTGVSSHSGPCSPSIDYTPPPFLLETLPIRHLCRALFPAPYPLPGPQLRLCALSLAGPHTDHRTPPCAPPPTSLTAGTRPALQ